ncbi:hypothetical protein AA15237_1075 [Komagataeibacter xylinus NBRC 15237]|nr:hypothetical protein AA15237_1075 [Komagataeibacter xylinus NBRC 15237]
MQAQPHDHTQQQRDHNGARAPAGITFSGLGQIKNPAAINQKITPEVTHAPPVLQGGHRARPCLQALKAMP